MKPPLFTCELCGKGGLDEPSMRHHLDTAHLPDSPLRCFFCDLAGVTPAEMNEHINVAHLDHVGGGNSFNETHLQATAFSAMNFDSADVSCNETEERFPRSQFGAQNLGHAGASMNSRMADNGSDAVSVGGRASESRNAQQNASQDTRRDAVRDVRRDCCKGSSLLDEESCEDTIRPRARQTLVYKRPVSDANVNENGTVSDGADDLRKSENIEEGGTIIDEVSGSENIRKGGAGNDDGVEWEGGWWGEGTGEECSDSTYSCPVCEFEFTDGQQLEFHVERHFEGESGSRAGGLEAGIQASLQSQLEERRRRLDADHRGQRSREGGGMQRQPLIEDWLKGASNVGTNQAPAKKVASFLKRARSNDESDENCDPHRANESAASSRSKQNTLRSTNGTAAKFGLANRNSSTDKIARVNGVQKWVDRGVDTGPFDSLRSHTEDVVGSLRQFYERHPGLVARWALCSATDHLSTSGEADQGWGCGYRNLQMMLSCLQRSAPHAQQLFTGEARIPSVRRLQGLIEGAWLAGFDGQGAGQLGGTLVGSRQWIGATEIVVFLSFFHIKCRLIDFHMPSAPNGSHPLLFAWVKRYFQERGAAGGLLPPLYLQHHGHCRLIIGIEELHGGADRLLLLDPGCPRRQTALLVTHCAGGKVYIPGGPGSKTGGFGGARGGGLIEEQGRIVWGLRKAVAGLKHRQYQIVAVEERLIAPGDEYEESKKLKSERV